MNAHSERCGRMFPDCTKRKEKLARQAFAAMVVSSGTGPQGRSLEVKGAAWEKGVAGAEYPASHDLSLAKLERNGVLMNTMVANPWVGE